MVDVRDVIEWWAESSAAFLPSPVEIPRFLAQFMRWSKARIGELPFAQMMPTCRIMVSPSRVTGRPGLCEPPPQAKIPENRSTIGPLHVLDPRNVSVSNHYLGSVYLQHASESCHQTDGIVRFAMPKMNAPNEAAPRASRGSSGSLARFYHTPGNSR
jgi:hypothetical protein